MQNQLLIINIISAVVVFSLIGWCVAERASIKRFALAATGSNTEPWSAAHALGGFIYSSIKQRGDDPALHPALAPLGAVPTAVVRGGGCCSGISRLYILALESVGVEAAQVTLYHTSGNAQHCLVEVSIDGVRQVIDPTYGFAYTTMDGQPMSLADLQAGKEPCFAALPSTARTAYPSNSYYSFNYSATKTANWTKSRIRRLAYGLLSRLPFVEIDRLLLPPSLEWPQLIMALGVALGARSLDVLAVVV